MHGNWKGKARVGTFENRQAFGRCCGQECPRSVLVAAASVSALRCIADCQSAESFGVRPIPVALQDRHPAKQQIRHSALR